MFDFLKGWRTVGFAGLTALIAFLSMPEFQAVVPKEYLPWVLLAVAMGNIFLRWITTTPMGRKE